MGEINIIPITFNEVNVTFAKRNFPTMMSNCVMNKSEERRGRKKEIKG